MKKMVLYILLYLVFIVIFNTIFFMVGGTNHTASVWISYAFIHFAYFMATATPILARKSSSSHVFNFSISYISNIYLFLEFVIGMVFIIIGSDSYKAALTIQIIVAAIYIVFLLMDLIADERTADSVEQHEKDVLYIKDMSSRVRLLIGKLTDKSLNKELERLYDLIYSSPSQSMPIVNNLEINITSKILELESFVRMNDEENALKICKNIEYLMEERNSIIKSNN